MGELASTAGDCPVVFFSFYLSLSLYISVKRVTD